MNPTILGIIASVLAMVIGLWKWYWGRDAELRKLRQKELEDVKKANDSSSLNSAINDVNNRL